MTADITLLYDTTAYADNITKFLELLMLAPINGSLTVAEIFNTLPLQVRSPDGRRDLEQRGGGVLIFNGGELSNNHTSQTVVGFVDDALGPIDIVFPANFRLSLSISAQRVVLSNVGDPLYINIPSIPSELLTGPFTFSSTEIGIGVMSSTIRDATGLEVLIDGSESAGSVSPFSWTDDTNTIQETYSPQQECVIGRLPDPDQPPQPKYFIYRDPAYYCRIITPGFEWGRDKLGEYQTLAEAMAAFEAFRANDTCMN